MDAYPAEYVRHELPLIALSGLGHLVEPSGPAPSSSWNPSPGAAIDRELGDVSVTFSRALRDEFLRADGATFTWNGAGNPQRSGLMGFKFSAVGQRFVFPRRKAAPAAQAPSEDASNAPASIAPHELHSTLSPLSPTSPLFPDGLLSTVWMNKHQHDVPAVFLCFVDINDDASAASLRDNHIKNEISRLKQALARSGYRTKLAVAILSDNSGGDIDERIAAIKRISGLDGRTSFFSLTRPGSKADTFDFVGSVLTALQPLCIDYYRDLTKHSRRKNNRGYIPSPFSSNASGTSQSLSNSGWRSRYEFKQGVFAEFRQEMDVAERHFAFALDELFNAEGVLETTPVWSSRWEEARCIADITALRILRCQLWRSSTTAAADFWTNHRERTRNLIDRRGKGSSTYGFAAWESRWAQIMAELIDRAHVPAFEIQRITPEHTSEDEADEEEFVIINISAPPEKAFVGVERLPPFHYLHHPGYWYRMACRWALERYQRVKSIPEDERKPPRQSHGANHTESAFDTYMVSPPHVELPPGATTNEKAEALILSLGQRAEDEFEKRRQFRMRSLLAIQRSHMLAEGGAHEKALHALLAIWNDMAWRVEGWWDLAGEVILNLYSLAEKTGNYRLISELKWEMTCTVFGSRFSKLLANTSPTDTPSISLSLDVRTRLSPISAQFSFSSKDGHVGDVVPCQIILAYKTAHSRLLGVTSIKISLNGGAIKIQISHNEAAQRSLSQTPVLKEASSNSNDQTKFYESHASLDFGEDQAHIINFNMPLRDVGEIVVSEMTIDMSMRTDIAHYLYHEDDLATTDWWLPDGEKLVSTSLDREISTLLQVLPKPPKVQLSLSDTHPQYFTSEDVTLSLLILNGENASVQGSLRINCSDKLLKLLDFRWEGTSNAAASESAPITMVGPIAAGAQEIYRAKFKALSDPTNVTLPFTVDYSIGSEKETVINKTATFHISFVTPIEAKFDLSPRLDTQHWPSFFTLPATIDGQSVPEGIRQQWVLSARLTSAAQESLALEEMALVMIKSGESVLCEIPAPSKPESPVSLATNSSHQELFTLFTQRKTLDDRRPAPLSLEVKVTWRRTNAASGSASSTTTIPVPTLQIPPAEPRVLCTSVPAPDEPFTNIVTYTLENPSMHFLTFALTMEAADHFAFAGPKLRSLAITPLSRAAVEYKVMLLDTGGAERAGVQGIKGKGKWVYPVLRVTDSYFNKTLRVIAASEGVRADERKGIDGGPAEGVAVWIPVE